MTENNCSFENLESIRRELKNLENKEDYKQSLKDDLLKACNESCCVNGKTHQDGNYYCYFHLPDENKITDFDKCLQDKNNNKFTGGCFPKDFNRMNLLFNEVEAIDFRGAVFNGKMHFNGMEFSNTVDFSGAVFKEKANFAETLFQKSCWFKRTEFKKTAVFRKCRFDDFTDFVKSKFNGNAHFNGSISGGESSGTFNFTGSKFRSDANFSECNFKGLIDFADSEFEKAVSFEKSIFNDSAFFTNCTFNSGAIFKKTSFGQNTANKVIVSFSESDFFGEAFFSSRESQYSAWQNAYFTFDRVSFKNSSQTRFISVQLNSTGFIRTDPRKIEFTNVRWGGKTRNSNKIIINELALLFQIQDEQIIKSEIKKDVVKTEKTLERSTLRMLSHTCRRLSINAEEDNRYNSASIFRQVAFECERFERKLRLSNWFNRLDIENEKDKKHFGENISGQTDKKTSALDQPNNMFGIMRRSGDYIIHGLYRFTSLYGESWGRAAIILIIVLMIFGFLYATPLAKFDFGEKPPEKVESVVQQICELAIMKGNESGLNGCDSAFYSLAVSALQKPEPKPANTFTKFLVILQTILAPLQVALLALAIRRKFMR